MLRTGASRVRDEAGSTALLSSEEKEEEGGAGAGLLACLFAASVYTIKVFFYIFN